MTLAFYDLCAVLTPCGPLKALVEMAQSRNDGIPGLLYEAQVEEAEEEEVVSPAPPRPVSSPIREQRREPTKISSSSSDQISKNSSGSSRSSSSSNRSSVDRHVDEKHDESDDRNARPVPRATPRNRHSSEDAEEEEHVYGWDNSVKLGLGDFIFYSLLVSKAALMGFLPFATCFLSIIEGLVLTMLLLAIVQAALPALPFSMLLGVACFFFSAYVLEPEYVYPLQSRGVFA